MRMNRRQLRERHAIKPTLPATMAERPQLIQLARSVALGSAVADDTIDAACAAGGVRRDQFDEVVNAMKKP